MMDEARERILAQAFADLLDQKTGNPGDRAATLEPELADDLEALAEIDRVLDPAALPDRLSGHKIAAEIETDPDLKKTVNSIKQQICEK